MDQLRNFADERLILGCVYCGGPEETKDHTPSKILLDSPLPPNLPVVGACRSCNNGFSQDEEYFACLIESAIAGSTNPDYIRRPKIANILRRSPALRAKIEGAKSYNDGQILFGIESERIKNVFLKLARGHAAFELSQLCRNEPADLWWSPLALLSQEQEELFNDIQIIEMLGEVGSRGLQRIFVTQVCLQAKNGEHSTLNLLINDWVDVQEGRYRYHASHDKDNIKIKIVISEYLACEIKWGPIEED